MSNIVIKVETMGLAPDSAIVAIGATQLVTPHKPSNKSTKFRSLLDWEDQERYVDFKTKVWWNEQLPSIKDQLDGLDDLRGTLLQLTEYLNGNDNNNIIWSNINFDIVILENAYRQLHIPIPWKHYNLRDITTLYSIYDIKQSNNSKKSVTATGIEMRNTTHDVTINCDKLAEVVKRCVMSLGYNK